MINYIRSTLLRLYLSSKWLLNKFEIYMHNYDLFLNGFKLTSGLKIKTFRALFICYLNVNYLLTIYISSNFYC